MLAPRPQIDEKCMENQKIFGWALSNPKFTHYLIMKYETYSSKICGILETILSSSFLPCSSILVWKLMVWIDWETPWPPPMGNRAKLWKNGSRYRYEFRCLNLSDHLRTHWIFLFLRELLQLLMSWLIWSKVCTFMLIEYGGAILYIRSWLLSSSLSLPLLVLKNCLFL